MCGLGAPVTERSFYDVARRDFENRMAVNFAVRLNGTLIGEAVLYNFDYRGSAELGCRIDKAYAGNGYGTEAFRCAAEWGLYQVNLSRIVAKCYKENEASYKMLSACMRRNGEDETFFYFEKAGLIGQHTQCHQKVPAYYVRRDSACRKVFSPR